MIVFYNIILILLACGILVKSGDWVIKSLTKIAAALRWSEFVVSFILVAVATSLPEIFIGLSSGLNKATTLSLGNVIGANIINLTLILGLVAILGRGLKFESKITQQNVIYAGLLSVYPLLLALDRTISRIDGLAIVAAFFLYMLLMFYQERRFSKIVEPIPRRELVKNLIYFILSLVLLIGSAELVTRTAKNFSFQIDLPLIFIGLIIVSLGTTLPELVFSLRAVARKHKEMSLGTCLGTVVTNSCLALGLAAVIYPIQIIQFSYFLIIFGFFILAIVFFTIFIRSRDELTWQEGTVLLLLYVIFLAVQFLQKR